MSIGKVCLALALFGIIASVSAHARYYDPVSGRFISRDPVDNVENQQGVGVATVHVQTAGRFVSRSTAPTHFAGVNLYQYVDSKPTKYLDPSGLIDEQPDAPSRGDEGYSAYHTRAVVAQKRRDEMQSVYNRLSAMCDVGKCLDRCKCTVEKCRKEAADIARSYVNTFGKNQNDGLGNNLDDLGLGWMCYQWQWFTFQELSALKLECWTLTRVGKIVYTRNGTRKLKHNYVTASLGSVKANKGPQKDCAKILDIWQKSAPIVFGNDELGEDHDWNFITDPQKEEGEHWDNDQWIKWSIPGGITKYTQPKWRGNSNFTPDTTWSPSQ
jgi:hypothetical protein